jgi:hypothetical protein
MSEITQKQMDRVRQECETRRMVAGTGDQNDGTACLMSAVNFALTGRLTDEPNACVSEAIRGLVIALHDQLPDVVRSGQAWRSLGPMMLGTGGDGRDSRRVLMAQERVRELASDRAVTYGLSGTYGLSDIPIWGSITDADSAYRYAAAAIAHAIATIADAADAADDREEFWARVDAPGLVRAVCEIGP